MNKRKSIEEIKKLVTEVCFTQLGYLSGEDVFDIKKVDGKAEVKVENHVLGIDKEYEISLDEWDSFIDGLYDEVRINKWKRSYRPDPYILFDGVIWELQISVEGGRKRIYRGDNTFPDNWDDFVELMGRFGEIEHDFQGEIGTTAEELQGEIGTNPEDLRR